MKNKLRRVHALGKVWKYVIDKNEVRIYEPETKQIKERVPRTEFMSLGNDENRWGDEDIIPSAIKQFIEKKYEVNIQK